MGAIRNRVLARRDLDPLRAARDLDGLTAALNAEGLMAPVQRFITARVVRTLPDGKAILAALKAARGVDDDVELAYTWLMQEAGLDIGDPAMLGADGKPGLLDELVATSILSADQATQLKALALKPVIVDRLEVEADLYTLDGSEKME